MDLNPKQTAFLFPGQGSQSVGMGQDLAKAYPTAADIFAQADEILKFPLSKLMWEGPEAQLNETASTQPALFVHSVAALRVFQEQNPTFMPDFVAGHSLGELSALVAAEALSFSTGLALVRRRGELMKAAGEASPGGMAAILGLDIPTVEELCQQATKEGEVIQIANDNCPGQVVISGDEKAMERAMPLAEQAGARRVVRLAVSIAAHSPLMAHAQAAFNQAVDTASIGEPETKIVGNVNAKPLHSANEIEADLRAQLTSPVRWTESMQYLLAQGVTHFVEVGTGNVLSGLIRRIERSAERFTLGTPDDFKKLGFNA